MKKIKSKKKYREEMKDSVRLMAYLQEQEEKKHRRQQAKEAKARIEETMKQMFATDMTEEDDIEIEMAGPSEYACVMTDGTEVEAKTKEEAVRKIQQICEEAREAEEARLKAKLTREAEAYKKWKEEHFRIEGQIDSKQEYEWSDEEELFAIEEFITEEEKKRKRIAEKKKAERERKEKEAEQIEHATRVVREDSRSKKKRKTNATVEGGERVAISKFHRTGRVCKYTPTYHRIEGNCVKCNSESMYQYESISKTEAETRKVRYLGMPAHFKPCSKCFK